MPTPPAPLPPGTQDAITAEVIAAAKNGDEQAHRLIYLHFADTLYTVIYRLIPRRASAEDLLHEVFVEVLSNINAYTGAGSFGGWLRSIAINKALSLLRSPWQRSAIWFDAVFMHAGDDNDEIAARMHCDAHIERQVTAQTDLEAALRQLSPLARSVIWLHDVEGYTHAEIGRLLGKTASFSKSQLARGHLRLRELLVPNDEALPCTPVSSSY